MKIDTRIAFISLLVGIGGLIVGIRQCQIAENDLPDTNVETKQEPNNPDINKSFQSNTDTLNSKSLGKPLKRIQNPIPENLTLRELASNSHAQSLYTYKGTVVDRNSNPMAGVSVTFENQTVTTRIDGTFELNVPKTLKEPRITLSKDGKNYPPYENPSGTSLVLPIN